MQLIGVITMLVNWGVLYFMVFEMKYIIATLESESHQELISRRKFLNRNRAILFSVFILIYAPITVFVFIGLRDYA